jgi:ribosomal protein L35AE/L33A
MLAPDAWVPLAEVMRPHGVRGELRLRLFNKDSDLLLSLDEVLVRFPEGDEQEVSVDGARRANDAILMKLHSVDDREGADELRGAIVCARGPTSPRSRRRVLRVRRRGRARASWRGARSSAGDRAEDVPHGGRPRRDGPGRRAPLGGPARRRRS